MTAEEIKQAVSAAVHEALDQREEDRSCRCCGTCELEPLQHRDHHKALSDVGLSNFYEDHKFTRSARESLRHGGKVLVAEVIKHVVTALITGAILYATMRGGQ